MQLTKGMYGTEFNQTSGLFGLRCGQMRNIGTHNSGWYNRAGEKIGFGDLTVGDFERIASELEDNDMFIVLKEDDSFWNFVTKPGLVGSMASTSPDVQAPGVDYVAEHAQYAIVASEMYVIDKRSRYKEGEQVELGHGSTIITAMYTRVATLKAMMLA
jgi:hypothetical protein